MALRGGNKSEKPVIALLGAQAEGSIKSYSKDNETRGFVSHENLAASPPPPLASRLVARLCVSTSYRQRCHLSKFNFFHVIRLHSLALFHVFLSFRVAVVSQMRTDSLVISFCESHTHIGGGGDLLWLTKKMTKAFDQIASSFSLPTVRVDCLTRQSPTALVKPRVTYYSPGWRTKHKNSLH